MNVRQTFCLAILAVSVLVSACSDSSGSTGNESEKYPRELTRSEAQSFSQIFYNNRKLENAEFLTFAGTLPSHGFVARGKVDWVNKTLSINVSLFETDTIDISAVFTPDGVFETYADIERGFAGENLEPRDWVYRPLEPENYAIDTLASAILGLGTDTPENPLLLNQNGVRAWGKETVGDESTIVYKGVDDRIYFVNNNSIMVRLKGKLSNFSDDVTIQFSNRQKSEVMSPNKTTSYDLAAVEDWYFELRPNF